MGSVNNPVKTTTYDLNKFVKIWMTISSKNPREALIEYIPERDEYVLLQAYIKATSLSCCEFSIHKTGDAIANVFTILSVVNVSSSGTNITTPPFLLKKGVSYMLGITRNTSDSFTGKGGALLILDEK